ncbi:hypothetical protein P175DRAFT_0228624 [Aspergillus ochraceoroseus IBT 24754]|uniref:Uncharacterized protein n=1 Tax=Aspergillus ochraceoroseus IBT 24754 TaxID=1392256 RepID=A0A2T5LWQ6_9EURO|nr:uncharacterized protein P175DRAFT_0228624 [Aspergillus ochraceoroseus IBT 24754]PTU20722.1 hypothetical protein P175DRAFT_0228624 [Aspergillus ochraceoroseus IBT 24754]
MMRSMWQFGRFDETRVQVRSNSLIPTTILLGIITTACHPGVGAARKAVQTGSAIGDLDLFFTHLKRANLSKFQSQRLLSG